MYTESVLYVYTCVCIHTVSVMCVYVVSVLCTWRRQVQLHLAQLGHGGLQLLDDQVIADAVRGGDLFLQELPQILQAHFQQTL